MTTIDPEAFITAVLQGALNSNAGLNAAIEWIGDNMEPSDVFSREKLEAWAIMTGYKLEE
jgi:hypothetical protein